MVNSAQDVASIYKRIESSGYEIVIRSIGGICSLSFWERVGERAWYGRLGIIRRALARYRDELQGC
jgi:hypothetical protein